jgi:type III pantothenate kinase
MNLVIDIGNTRAKVALFQADKPVRDGILELSEPASLFRFLGPNKAAKLILSSVVKQLPAFLEDYLVSIPSIEFAHDTPVPIQNKYESASTLGGDRLAAAVGGWKRYTGADLLVIDAGTCIKYNFVSAAGEYLGGGISPGINMRFMAMHNLTGKLPLIEANEDFDHLIGSTTQDSLLSGVMNGILEEVEGIINRYKTQYHEVQIVVTGGNYHFFEKRLKKRIFAHPNIVLEGLNEILEYNCNGRK